MENPVTADIPYPPLPSIRVCDPREERGLQIPTLSTSDNISEVTDCPTSIQTPDISRVEDTIYVEVKDGEARISFYTPSTQQVDTYNGTSVSYHTTADDVRICISRHNYIPYVTNSINQVYIQNETINADRTYSGDIIKAGKNVTDKKAPGNVIINNGTVNMVGNRVELQAGTKVSKGAVLKIDNP